jgi:hypothetical protein
LLTRDPRGANLEAGKAIMRRKIAEAQAQYPEGDETKGAPNDT